MIEQQQDQAAIEQLDFRLTCHTKSGCGEPAVTLVRTSSPVCSCRDCFWTLCVKHTAKLYAEWDLEHQWRCVDCGARFVASFAQIVQEVRSL